MASSAILPDPFDDRPVAPQSGAAAEPTPKAGSNRPSERKSIVAHCFAISRGSRRPREATFMPNFIRRVRPARAAIALIHSKCGIGETRRSVCQRLSTPPTSAKSTHSQYAFAEENGKSAKPKPTLTAILKNSPSTKNKSL